MRCAAGPAGCCPGGSPPARTGRVRKRAVPSAVSAAPATAPPNQIQHQHAASVPTNPTAQQPSFLRDCSTAWSRPGLNMTLPRSRAPPAVGKGPLTESAHCPAAVRWKRGTVQHVPLKNKGPPDAGHMTSCWPPDRRPANLHPFQKEEEKACLNQGESSNKSLSHLLSDT
jgi:hypothetical protein